MSTSIIDSLQSLAKSGKSQKSSALASKATTKPSAEQTFLDYAKKTPAQKLRDSLLKSVGVTEDQLASMPPEQRQQVEQKIADKIKETLDKKNASGESTAGFFKDISA